MFFRIIVVFILSVLSSSIFANGYCDSRPSQSERERCYRNASTSLPSGVALTMAFTGAKDNLGETYTLVFNTPKIPEDKRKEIEEANRAHYKKYMAECKSDDKAKFYKCAIPKMQKQNRDLIATFCTYNSEYYACDSRQKKK